MEFTASFGNEEKCTTGKILVNWTESQRSRITVDFYRNLPAHPAYKLNSEKTVLFDSKRVGENHGVKLVVFASNLVAILYRFIHKGASIQVSRHEKLTPYILAQRHCK
jgi:hypothetical protein